MKKGRPRFPPVLTAVGIAALGVGLLTRSSAVAEGVSRGLTVCGGTLIPSLFPFMALAGFLSITKYGRILSVPFRFVTTKIYKLPRDLGVVVLLSLIGGYPVGAKMIAGLLEAGRIDKPTAERMLCFCVNSGPSFLIAAVGAGLFLDRTAGVILFATQTAATLLVGWAVSLRVPRPGEAETRFTPMDNATALVAAVNNASNGMIAMCAFAILFSGLLSMVTAGGVVEWLAARLPLSEAAVRAVVCGFFEVTTGCIAATRVGGVPAFGMVSAIVSFGGLSVLFQVMSCFRDAPIRFRPFLLSRVAHMGLSTAAAVPLYRLLCNPLPIWLTSAPPLAQADGKTILISVCLLAMCSIFLLHLESVSNNGE